MGTYCTGPYKTLCFLLGVILIAWEDFEQKICFKKTKTKTRTTLPLGLLCEQLKVVLRFSPSLISRNPIVCSTSHRLGPQCCSPTLGCPMAWVPKPAPGAVPKLSTPTGGPGVSRKCTTPGSGPYATSVQTKPGAGAWLSPECCSGPPGIRRQCRLGSGC